MARWTLFFLAATLWAGCSKAATLAPGEIETRDPYAGPRMEQTAGPKMEQADASAAEPVEAPAESEIEHRDASAPELMEEAPAAAETDDDETLEAAGELYFIDSKTFDKRFSKILKDEPASVTLLFRGTVTVNEVPEHLDMWLAAVDHYKGGIDIEEDPDVAGTRFLGTAFSGGSFVFGAFSYLKQRRMLKTAKRYDATVYYHPATGAITRVVFGHKQPDD